MEDCQGWRFPTDEQERACHMNDLEQNTPTTEDCLLQHTAAECRTVYIVDQDPAVHESLIRLLQKEKYIVRPFAAAASLLSSVSETATGVLILELDAGDMSGLELQAELRRRNIGLKVIFLSGNGNVETSVRALRAGAVDFLEKPYTKRHLLNSIETAVACVNTELEERRQREEVERKCRRLTPREREVMKYIVSGLSSRHLADYLSLSRRTVEIHRAKIMTKMEASTLPDLVRMVYLCGDCRPEEVFTNEITRPGPG
jgi:two-component system, LuxR family, response regulator FixJ